MYLHQRGHQLHHRCDRRIQAGELHQLSLRPGHFDIACVIYICVGHCSLCWWIYICPTALRDLRESKKFVFDLCHKIRLMNYIVSDSGRRKHLSHKCLLHSTTEGSTSSYTVVVGSLREALHSRSLAYNTYSCALWAARHLHDPRENKAERGCENTSLFTAPFPLLFGLYIRASAAGLSSTARLHCDQCCPQLKRPAHIPFLPFHFYMAADRGC